MHIMSTVVRHCLFRQRQAIHPFLRTACERYVGLIRKFCSEDHQATFSFKDRLLQKRIHPEEHEVLLLKQRYPEPRQLVDEVFRPIVEIDREKAPNLHFDKIFGDRIWKARLQLQWPHVTKITASHVSEEKATENAYLLACELLQEMGFIENKHGVSSPMKPETVIKFLEKFAGDALFQTKDMFKYVTTLESQHDEEGLWQTNLHINWPVSFTVSSKTRGMSLSVHEACLLAAMKLKRLGFLDVNNQLRTNTVLRMARKSIDLENFNPDFEIYVDASKVGLGAYLLTNDEDTVRWISDVWSNNLHFNPLYNSSVAEFYALVTAIFTWKYKFKNKKVLCYSDNIDAVSIVNNGLYLMKEKSLYHTTYKALYDVLTAACKTNNISLFARHVCRMDNVAADLLSRNNVEKFRKIVPTARDIPKKAKNLHFCKPKNIKPGNNKKKR